jgi:hypothetical protein
MIATITGLSAALPGDTIFNDIDGSTGGGFIAAFETAAPFTAPEAVSLENVSVFVDATFSGSTMFTAEIYSDVADHPGSVLAKVSNIPAPAEPQSVSVDFSSDAISLSSGATYWLSLQPTMFGGNPTNWFYNPQLDGVPLDFGGPSSGEPWAKFRNAGSVQFEVNGTVASPEPAVSALNAIGIALFAALSLRRFRFCAQGKFTA